MFTGTPLMLHARWKEQLAIDVLAKKPIKQDVGVIICSGDLWS